MDRKNLLTVTSLISILLLTFHFTDDMVHGLDTPGPSNLIAIAIVVVFSIGPLLLRERLVVADRRALPHRRLHPLFVAPALAGESTLERIDRHAFRAADVLTGTVVRRPFRRGRPRGFPIRSRNRRSS